MSDGVAYSSTEPEVLSAWESWKKDVDDVSRRRDELSERYGRRLMVNRIGFGHGTRVVGFERLDGDVRQREIGDDGALRLPARGETVTPNLRRRAGKVLAADLAKLDQDGPNLPGMPGWTLAGMHSLAPALFEHDSVIWAYWSQDIAGARAGGEVDDALWGRRLLSEYFAAAETRGLVAS